MKRNPIRIVLLTVMAVKLATRAASTQMIISPTGGDISCSGSLVVLTSNRGKKMFHGSKTNTLLKTKSVHAEGCGCYYVYKRPGFKATSSFSYRMINWTDLFKVK